MVRRIFGGVIMKLSQQTHDYYNNYLLESIDFEGYDLPQPKTNKEKINTFFNVFKSESGWNIERVGEWHALSEWLSGLPSVIDIPFDNYSIIKLAIKAGSIDENASDKEKDKLLSNYWDFIANKLIVLRNGHINRKLLNKSI